MKYVTPLVLLVVFLFPLILFLFTAIQGVGRAEDISLGSWVYYLFSPRVLESLLSSFLYSVGTVFFTLVFTLLPARFFAGEREHPVLESLLLLPAILPPFAYIVGLHFLFLKVGLGDSFLGVILVLSIVSYPYMLRSLTSGYKRSRLRQIEYAAHLGAGFWQRTFEIELPLILPSIIAGAHIVFLVAFSDYILVFLIGGGSVGSLTQLVFPVISSSNRGLAGLYNLYFMVVPFLLFLVSDVLVLQLYRKKNML